MILQVQFALDDVSGLMNKNKIKLHIDGLVQDCSNFIANALGLLQSWTKPSTSATCIQLTS